MITAIDTNILIDIFVGDKMFGQASANALRRCMNEGACIACELVWVETAAAFPDHRLFEKSMDALGMRFDPVNQTCVKRSAEAWRAYRKNGGHKDRVVEDFVIGAHALVQCNRLLTRDRGFYRKYFKGLNIIDPSKAR